MGYYFELKPAMACGVDGAVMLSNLKFWIDKNRANEKHFHDGRYWTYNSVKAFGELFPFWSKGQISTILNRLEKQNYIVSGNYNKSAYDRTKWYALTDKGEQLFGDYGMQNFSGNGTSFSNSPISQNQEMVDLNSKNAISQNQEMDDLISRNEFLKIEKPIPYNKPYNKQTDNKQTDNKQTDNNTNKRINYQKIVNMYNDTCVSYPKVTRLSESRKKAIRARMNIYTEEDFQELFTKAENSNFLKGCNDRNWSANFDWLIKDSSMSKVLDGNYDNNNNNYQRKNKIDLQPTKSEEPTKPTNPKDEIITEGTFKGWTVGKLEEERRKAGERYRAEMERRKKEQENNLC